MQSLIIISSPYDDFTLKSIQGISPYNLVLFDSKMQLN